MIAGGVKYHVLESVDLVVPHFGQLAYQELVCQLLRFGKKSFGITVLRGSGFGMMKFWVLGGGIIGVRVSGLGFKDWSLEGRAAARRPYNRLSSPSFRVSGFGVSGFEVFVCQFPISGFGFEVFLCQAC